MLMYVQLADLTIRYPERVVEDVLVRVKNSFILANFVVVDMKGDQRETALEITVVFGSESVTRKMPATITK